MENYNRWYVIETQMRADGDVNFVKTEQYSVAKALNYYYTRLAAYTVDTTYPKAGVAVVDSELNVLKHEVITTSYKAETTTEE